MTIRREAQELWLNNLRSDDRVLVTGAAGWFGRTAIAMTREVGLELLATGSKDQQIEIDGQSQAVHAQSLELISAFKPTVVIDTAFVTRERLPILGHKTYVETNQKLIVQSLAIAALPSVRKYIGFSRSRVTLLGGLLLPDFFSCFSAQPLARVCKPIPGSISCSIHDHSCPWVNHWNFTGRASYIPWGNGSTNWLERLGRNKRSGT